MANLFYGVMTEEEAKIYFDKLSSEYCTCQCYSDYDEYYRGDDSKGNIYFGFLAHPDITKLADEMNANFKNIKVDIVGMKELDINHDDLIYIDVSSFNYCLFRIILDDKYTQASKFVLTLVLAQFIRAYCPYYYHYQKMILAKENFIDSALSAQDTTKYGGWLCCDNVKQSCDRDTFNKFDDVDLINSITEGRTEFETMPSVHKLIRVLDGSQQLEYAKRSRWQSVYD